MNIFVIKKKHLKKSSFESICFGKLGILNTLSCRPI